MDKQAYERSVSLVLNKEAGILDDIKNGITNIDWSSIGNFLKQHYLDNKKHYNRAAAGAVLLGLGGGFADGWRGAGSGALLGSLAFGGGSKLYDMYNQYVSKNKNTNTSAPQSQPSGVSTKTV